MKIFVLLPRIPWTLEKGDKLRAFNQIKCLSEKHQVILCALNAEKSTNKDEARNVLQPFCSRIEFIDLPFCGIAWNLFRAFVSGRPMQTGYYYNSLFHRKIHKLISETQPDMLYGQFVRVAPYLIGESLPKTLDYQDVLSAGMKRREQLAPFLKKPIFGMEYRRLLAYERKMFDKFDVKTIIADSDRQCIDHPQKNEIVIVPNGVDFAYYQPKNLSKRFDLLFCGNMAYPPNVNAVEFLNKEILPIVRKTLPNVTLCIAGATPTAAVKAVASNSITVTGRVDDMREMYLQSRVFIAPMRIGTGLQNKLLEAMAMRLPCITTPLANGSLCAESDSEILVGETAEQLANHIITLLTNAEKSDSLANNGYSFVHKTYDWHATTEILSQAMEQAMSN